MRWKGNLLPILWIFFNLNLYAQPAEDYLDSAILSENADSTFYFLTKSENLARASENNEILAAALLYKSQKFSHQQQADSAAYYLTSAINECRQRVVSDSLKAEIYYEYAVLIGYRNLYLESLSYLDTVELYLDPETDPVFFAELINRQAAVNDNMGRRTEALELYLKAYELFDSLGRRYEVIQVKGNVAIIYKKLGDWDRAMTHYNESIEELMEMGEVQSARINQVNRGLLRKDIGDYPGAFADLIDALKYFESVNFTYAIAATMHNMSEAHYSAGNLDSAIYYANHSGVICKEFQYSGLIANNFAVLAKVLQKQRKYVQSNENAMMAYELTKQHQLPEELVKVLSVIALNFERLGADDKALKYFKELKQMSDSLYQKTSRQKLDQMRIHYGLMQKENQIASLESESAIQKTLAEKEHKMNMALTLGISLLISFLIVLFILYFRQMRLSGKLNLQKQQLADLNEDKDKLVAMVAHDLRSPLNNIWGLLGLIRKDSQDSETDRLVDMATQSANVLRGRINLILDVKAINAGKLNIRIGKVQVCDVMKILEYNISTDAFKKEMDVQFDPCDSLYCEADESYLLQVLENFCTNAIKYSPKKSKIQISAYQENGNVLFKVTDEGQGIPEEEQKNLFTGNGQISTVPTDNEKSTGLGLVIVKRYVDAMKGEVWYEGQPGRGSTFVLKLPVYSD